MRHAMTTAGLALALALACQPAHAFQKTGMPLDDVLAVAKPYPNLVLQVRLQLVRAGLKREQVSCSSEAIPANFQRIAGTRHGPYRCQIGKRTLVITSSQTYLDGSGRRLKAGDPELARKAAKVSETHLKWSWQ